MTLRGRSSALLVALLWGALPSVARAEVAVLTMSPGPRLFERFGHTALRVGDRVYNFGTFSADDPELPGKFLTRRLEYWLSVGNYDEHLGQYAERRITTQVLALAPEEERALAAALEDNARPEHRAYRYDFFLDNCSTRVRDAIDRVTGGALGRAGERAGRATYRQHVESVLAGPPLLAPAVSLLLNATTDQPTTRWQEAFLPRELEGLLAEARRPDGRPLVAATREWLGPGHLAAERQRSRPGPNPIDLLLLVLVLGPAPLGVLLGAGGRARRVLGAGVLAFALVGGLVGAALWVASLTPYPCARANENALLLSPLLLLAVPAGVALLVGAPGREAWSLRLSRGALGLSLLAVCAHVALHAASALHQQDMGLALGVLCWLVPVRRAL